MDLSGNQLRISTIRTLLKSYISVLVFCVSIRFVCYYLDDQSDEKGERIRKKGGLAGTVCNRRLMSICRVQDEQLTKGSFVSPNLHK